MKKRTALRIAAACLLGILAAACQKENDAPTYQKKQAAEEEEEPSTPTEKIYVGYVTYWDTTMPDLTYLTHVNYAFGKVANTFDKVEIKTPSRLKQFVAQKKNYPDLKVLLSIGGWGAGNFSEMVADDNLRMSFCKSCLSTCQSYGLDGIDIDWEYPTSSSAGISSSPDDTKNFTLLMRDLRATLGDDMLLTMASTSSAKYVDFKSCVQYMDYVILMTYDMGNPPKHNAGLYTSSMTYRSVDESVTLHKAAGVPYDKIVVGVPFFGRIKKSDSTYDSIDYNDIPFDKYTRKWDATAMVPYLVDDSGNMVISYDDEESVALKGEYVVKKNLKGVMVWDLEEDDSNWSLNKALGKAVFEK